MKNKIQYLAFDSLEEGVGASQILNYLSRLSKNFEITLVNFEKSPPSDAMRQKMLGIGVTWQPLAFEQAGTFYGLIRVIRLMTKIDKKIPVHARGDLAALAAIMSGNKQVLWDCRALQADQRFAIASGKSKYVTYLINRIIELIIAKKSKLINVITHPAARILSRRYGLPASKFSVISTCVDLETFPLRKMPAQSVLRLLIPGTLSRAYDIPLMNKIILELRGLCKLEVTLAVGNGAETYWKEIDYDHVKSIPHSEIPNEIANSHFGMSIWKSNLGICLSSVSSTKIPEFLATGRPVIANFNQGDIGKFLETYECGVTTSICTVEHVKEYVEEILRLLSDESTVGRCRGLAENYYSLSDAVSQLGQIYMEMQEIGR